MPTCTFCWTQAHTVNHVIFTASKFGDFKNRHWRSLFLEVFQFNAFNVIFYSHRGATLEGKRMLPMCSIFFHLMVAPLRRGLLYIETYSTIRKLGFNDTDLLFAI